MRIARRLLVLQVQGTKLLFPFPLEVIISWMKVYEKFWINNDYDCNRNKCSAIKYNKLMIDDWLFHISKTPWNLFMTSLQMF